MPEAQWDWHADLREIPSAEAAGLLRAGLDAFARHGPVPRAKRDSEDHRTTLGLAVLADQRTGELAAAAEGAGQATEASSGTTAGRWPPGERERLVAEFYRSPQGRALAGVVAGFLPRDLVAFCADYLGRDPLRPGPLLFRRLLRDVLPMQLVLLEPFRVETVAPEHAGGLAAAAAGQYGEEWTRGVIDGWFRSEHYFEADRYEWVERLPGLCGALRTAGAPEAARLLAAGAWDWMGDQLRLWTTTARAGMREPQLEMLSSPLVRLLEAADDELRDEIAAALHGYGDNVLGCLMPALRSAAALPAAARRAAGSMW
jgi:hypothetical protein